MILFDCRDVKNWTKNYDFPEQIFYNQSLNMDFQFSVYSIADFYSNNFSSENSRVPVASGDSELSFDYNFF